MMNIPIAHMKNAIVGSAKTQSAIYLDEIVSWLLRILNLLVYIPKMPSLLIPSTLIRSKAVAVECARPM